MTRDEVLELCARLPGVVEDYPFGDGVAVFKVGGRMFALYLRARHPSVRPGYHQNKRHWNTVELDGSIEDGDIRLMIDHSYELVVSGLTRAVRDRLEGG